MPQLNIFERLGLTEKVIRLSATKSAREIKEILLNEDGANISHVTISNYIKDIRKDRQEATKAAIAETVTPGLTSDLEFFDEMLAVYKKRFLEFNGIGMGGTKLMIEVGKELRATVETKVKIAGGNTEDEMTVLAQLVNGLNHHDLAGDEEGEEGEVQWYSGVESE